jgi:hypothetical protein
VLQAVLAKLHFVQGWGGWRWWRRCSFHRQREAVAVAVVLVAA